MHAQNIGCCSFEPRMEQSDSLLIFFSKILSCCIKLGFCYDAVRHEDAFTYTVVSRKRFFFFFLCVCVCVCVCVLKDTDSLPGSGVVLLPTCHVEGVCTRHGADVGMANTHRGWLKGNGSGLMA